jgi:inosine kinase
MKFPGRRKSKHYFPVTDRGRVSFQESAGDAPVYVVGIDQLLVDIEAGVDEATLDALGLPKGHSALLDEETIERVYQQLKADGQIKGEFAGGSIGNTIHNYSVLADDHSVLLGTISRHITVGDYAFHYVRNTSSRVDLNHLHTVEGPMGRAICFITPDGERSFGIGRGIMDELPAAAIDEELIAGSSALVLTAYLLRDESMPIFGAAMRAIEMANRHSVPILLSLGTAPIVCEKRDFLRELIASCGTILIAGNFEEVCVLTGESDALRAGEAALDLADLLLLTRDQHGLYLCAWVDEEFKRQTKDPILSKSIPEYNRYEYSRAMARRHCARPMKVFSHINPYLGGPSVIRNTNGAGDAALAALLHDMAANNHHRQVAPSSPKNKASFLTYSSIHQICKYANRVSYEVLRGDSPRLMHGMPEREDSLEEAYWAC